MKLGFNARISFRSGHEAQGLKEGIELFEVAEQLGFDTGWVYQRHFDNYLSAPLPFLSAVGQRTQRIGLGTAIIGVRYEAPIQLAEAAAVTDLLVSGRLQLGLGTGQGGFDAVFGQTNADFRADAYRRLDRVVSAIAGESLGEIVDDESLISRGEALTLRPRNTSLRERIWFGAGSVESAVAVAERGLRLLLSTILSGDVDDFGGRLAEAVDAYRAAHRGPHESRVAIARSVLPATTPQLDSLYEAYDLERQTFGPGASRPSGALATQNVPARRLTMSPVFRGAPDDIVERLLDDPSVHLADELICFLPPAFGLRDNLRLLEDIAVNFAPKLSTALKGAS